MSTGMIKPEWMRKKIQWLNLRPITELNTELMLNTVCESADCPNRSECWGRGVATFMILGNTCTRNCGFCNIDFGKPDPLDPQEPERLAKAVQKLKLEHVVVTSVARDELPDQGANHFARSIEAIRRINPGITIEVLTPDFCGKENLIQIVVDAKPEIFNHNIETIARLTPTVRFKATYLRSLAFLQAIKRMDASILTKSGMMLGLGETFDEVVDSMKDLRSVGCDILTIGQYLPPSPKHLPLVEYIHPDIFKKCEVLGQELGFLSVASGPYIRSSYNADEIFASIKDSTKMASA